jgi:hypothetical protein
MDKMKTKEYRETARGHGNKWILSRAAGMRQRLSKGDGDALEISAKLAILLEVLEERKRLADQAVIALPESFSTN